MKFVLIVFLALIASMYGCFLWLLHKEMKKRTTCS
jgi:hypothetical protein